MIVVADTSPLHLLVRIEQVDVLPSLFGKVCIPSRVAQELLTARSQLVQEFIAKPPEWLKVHDPQIIETIPSIDAGEEAAINLAQELNADLLLIDDLAGRRAAQLRGIAIVGTLKVLERGAREGLVDLRQALERIRHTDFYASERLLQLILERFEQQP